MIPVVIVSAADVLEPFADDLAILAKPLDVERFKAEVQRIVGPEPTPTLILAEDDDDLRTVLTRPLVNNGYTVVAAATGNEACRLFDGTFCNAVVVDLHMADGDGFQVIEHVRHAVGRSDTPVLVVSGSNSGGGEARAIQLGAKVYVAKPVDTATLVDELTRLVS